MAIRSHIDNRFSDESRLIWLDIDSFVGARGISAGTTGQFTGLRFRRSGPAMPAGEEKPLTKSKHGRTLFWLYCAHILQCLSTTIREQAAPDMVFRLFNNDMVSSAKFLGNYDSFSGLIAFLVSPSFGGLSDQIGRKPFLLLWPVASTILSGVVASKPSKALMFIQMGVLGALVNAFETSVRCVIPDMVDGDERAIANANIGACQGAAFFLGSYLTGALSGIDPRLSMATAAGFSGLSGLLLAAGVPETMQKEKRTNFEISKANPFGFTALLRPNSEYNKPTGGAIRRLTCVFALQKTVWPGLNEQIKVYTKGQLNWQPANFARYMTLVGVGHLVGNKLTGPTLRLFGHRLHTHVANVLFAGMFAAIGSAHWGWGTNQIHAGQTLAWVAVPHAVSETAISMQADVAGNNPDGTAKIGQGKLQGDVGNLIALIKVFVPMLYGQAMAWGARNNIPGAAIFTASGWWLISSAMFLMVRKSDVDPALIKAKMAKNNAAAATAAAAK
eukprot:SAG22_NODE_1884_length_3377_cov_29.524100_3_plen_502_part_00